MFPLAVGAVLAATVSPAAIASGTYTVTDLGTLGGSYSYATRINDSGLVVGLATTSGDTEQHAFLYNGSLPPLDLGGGEYSLAFGINPLGQVVGVFAFEPGNVQHGFFYGGTLPVQDLGTLGPAGLISLANGINRNGNIVGSSFIVTGGLHATFWPTPTRLARQPTSVRPAGTSTASWSRSTTSGSPLGPPSMRRQG